ncbi:MAG: DUF456 domain-containing protein [Anaeromyxobacteraceae bacterium]|nr:DUF456 domain-containing protein [Anaeromyxobacteraceae bacterium]
MAMDWVLYALGAVALLLGLAGVILPVLPGSLLLFGGALLVAWAGGFALVGWPTLTVVGLLAAVIWAVDWVAAALGAKATGASRWAVAGASLGLLVGMFLGPVGIIVGPAVGAVALEYWQDPDFEQALKAGLGTFLGFLLGSVVKVTLAFVLVGALVVGLLV